MTDLSSVSRALLGRFFSSGGLRITETMAATGGVGALAIAAVMQEMAVARPGAQVAPVSASPQTLGLLGDYAQHLRQLAGVPLAALTWDELREVAKGSSPEKPEAGMASARRFLENGKEDPKLFLEGLQAIASRANVEGAEFFEKHLLAVLHTRDEHNDVVGAVLFVNSAPDYILSFTAKSFGVEPAQIERLPGNRENWLRLHMSHEMGHVRAKRVNQDIFLEGSIPGFHEEGAADNLAATLAAPLGASPKERAQFAQLAKYNRQLRAVRQVSCVLPNRYAMAAVTALPGDTEPSLTDPVAILQGVRHLRAALDQRLVPELSEAQFLDYVLEHKLIDWTIEQTLEAEKVRRFGGSKMYAPEELSLLEAVAVAPELDISGDDAREVARQIYHEPALRRLVDARIAADFRAKSPAETCKATRALLASGAFQEAPVARRLAQHLVEAYQTFMPTAASPTLSVLKRATAFLRPRAVAAAAPRAV